MKSKTYRYSPNSQVQIQRYGIFENKVYDKETGRYRVQYPIKWSEDPGDQRGKNYTEYSIIPNIAKNYDLYAIWPTVNIYVTYNLFSSTRRIQTPIDKNYTLENMSADVDGFKGWLDQNKEFYLPETTIIPHANTQLFLSTCQELSISYDLNGGNLAEGKTVDPQTALYSKWMNPDYQIEDIDATIRITASEPSLGRADAQFGYWVIDNYYYYKNDQVYFKENKVAKAQWLYTPDYKFFESTAFNGDEHGEKYGELRADGPYDDVNQISKKYEARPGDGYKFDFFKVSLFDGYEMQPEQTYNDSCEKIVIIHKYDPRDADLTQKLTVYANTVAYFSEDFDSWFRIKYVDSHIRLVRKPASSSQTVTNALLQTADSADIIHIQFPTNDVEHVENGIFANCTSLTEIQIASKLREFPADMCKNDIKFTTISYSALPLNLTAVGASAFEGCTSLVDIGQPLVDKIKTFGARAFAGTGIQSFTFGADTTSVGNAIFSGTTQLTEFTLKTSTLGVLGTTALDGSSVIKIILTNISSKDILGS